MNSATLVYRLSIEIATNAKLTQERREELASAAVEALRRCGVTFWAEHNSVVSIEYIKTHHKGGEPH